MCVWGGGGGGVGGCCCILQFSENDVTEARQWKKLSQLKWIHYLNKRSKKVE